MDTSNPCASLKLVVQQKNITSNNVADCASGIDSGLSSVLNKRAFDKLYTRTNKPVGLSKELIREQFGKILIRLAN